MNEDRIIEVGAYYDTIVWEARKIITIWGNKIEIVRKERDIMGKSGMVLQHYRFNPIKP